MLCDRKDFIDCINGDLMIRDKSGTITHLGDKIEVYKAIKCAERGNEVILTVKGLPFSKLINFTEIKI